MANDCNNDRRVRNSQFLAGVLSKHRAIINRRQDEREHGKLILELSFEDGLIVHAAIDDKATMRPGKD